MSQVLWKDARRWCGAVGLSLFVGCTAPTPSEPSVKTSVVRGKVTVEGGQPFPGGAISLRRVDGSGLRASAEIQPDGSFSLQTVQDNGQLSPGAVPGQYKVVVTPVMDANQSAVVPIELAKEVTVEERDNDLSLVVPKAQAQK